MARTGLRVVLAGGLVIAAAGTFFLTGGDGTAPAPGPFGPSAGGLDDFVWDRGVRFQLRNVQCGTGPTGDLDTDEIRPRGMYCWAYFTVLNESDVEVRLPWAAQRLVTDEGPVPPSERAMSAILLDEPAHFFDGAIPPGGGGNASLVFDLPLGAERRALRLHVAEGSPGATIRLDPCPFLSDSGGGCYAEDDLGAEPEVSYPFTISGHRGGMALLNVCFDYRQWVVVEPHPTEGMPEDFTGHGVMTLTSPDRAEFRDNSGTLLTLSPTPENETHSGLCGSPNAKKG